MYIAIDLKSFYASVECVERGLDPLDANLVVADSSRTEKTICLAVTPALKKYGIPGRARLFEAVQAIKRVNAERLKKVPGHCFKGRSALASELDADPSLELDYVIAVPRMAFYMDYSRRIYRTYLKYVSPQDIHVYSVDEVFIDADPYRKTYGLSARDLAMKMIRDVLHETGITATAGIGTNLYLAKIAMDIVAKRMPADRDGVRIAELDERTYRELLWTHRPLTDFWRIGPGTVRRLESHGLFTLGDVARCSLGKDSDYYNEDLLYKVFGVNAELLIDHAWGYEPATIADIRAFRPENNSLSSGQVLSEPYSFEKARLVVREMTDLLVLDLVEKRLVTDQMVLNIGYDTENLKDPVRRKLYRGPVETDRYGREVPKTAHGSINLEEMTSSTKRITEAVMTLFDRIVDPALTVRRMYVVAARVIAEPLPDAETPVVCEQLDLFTDYEARDRARAEEKSRLKKERSLQEAVISLKQRYGKNAVLKGMNLEEGATAAKRNSQIGGHRA